MAAVVALFGCALLLFREKPKGTLAGALGLSAIAICTWLIAPRATFERIGSIIEQLRNGDLNQRVDIWTAGWRAFLEAPLWGHGAGSFVIAARLAPIDTAHNTVLSILVEGGLFSLALAAAVVGVSVRFILATKGAIRIALMTMMAVWFVSSLIGTVVESRTTWLLLGIIAVTHRLAKEQPEQLERVFAIEGSVELLLTERVS